MVNIPETNIFAPEHGWLEYDRFLLGWPSPFSGAMLVLGRVYPLLISPLRIGLWDPFQMADIHGL